MRSVALLATRSSGPAAGAAAAPPASRTQIRAAGSTTAAAAAAAAAAAPAASWRFPAATPFLEALATCETFRCVRDAHLQPRGPAAFNYPHFMIAGWSKSATTSLHHYLAKHPGVKMPAKKEPALFTNRCKYPGGAMRCPDKAVAE